MTEQYDPYKNAIAEWINRNLKYEYDLKNQIKNANIAQNQQGKPYMFIII
jgi:uncharacterized protein YaaR (DUF327 family)